MLRDIDNYYLQKQEPIRSCLQALRHLILAYHTEINEVWKYGMPGFTYKGKMFCYLWVDKKRNQPYINMVDGNLLNHAQLLQEDRKTNENIAH